MELFRDVARSVSSSLMNASAALPQSKTNGASTWGTSLAKLLPLYLSATSLTGPSSSSSQTDSPWGNKTELNTNVYTDPPVTGVVRNYEFTISRGVIAPDGYERPVMLINGAFPGPLIEANWGDQITVTVHNNITGPEEGTAVHWHGFLQEGTPWADGVPGVSECPLAPGQTEVYRFNASLYGTSWYHSHYSAQYSSGVMGPMVVYGPTTTVSYDVDIGPVILSDWYHRDYLAILKEILAPGGSPRTPSDNNLINGKMNFDCSTVAEGDTTPCTDSAGVSKFVFQTGKTHRLRLINSGSEGMQHFSIDGHQLTVIANDFVPVQPYNTTTVKLGVGQRADVLVVADAGPPTSSFWMRSTIPSCSLARQPLALAAVYYDQADQSSTPQSTATTTTSAGPDGSGKQGDDEDDDDDCTNDDLSKTVPLYEIPVPSASVTHPMEVSLFVNESGVSLWKFGGVSFRSDYNAPVLELANAGNFVYPEEWNVINFGTNSSVRLVVTNKSPSAHPMHLHGHSFYVLSEGSGEWDGSIVRASNPQRRDVQQVREGGHVVLQFDGNNPGVWAFHCHIAWHASGGFFSSLLVDPGAIQSMVLPPGLGEVCKGWNAWTKYNVPDQIDSGE